MPKTRIDFVRRVVGEERDHSRPGGPFQCSKARGRPIGLAAGALAMASALGLGVAVPTGCHRPPSDGLTAGVLRDLAEESAHLIPLGLSRAFRRGAELTPEEIGAAERFVGRTPDYRSFHLLMTLRKQRPETYQRLSNGLKAEILCSWLREIPWMNDWGHLGPGQADFEAARALLETGRSALPHLRPILADRGAAPLWGVSDATRSRACKYRRCDFAYRYAKLILGEEPTFSVEPKDRDAAIAELRKRLGQTPPRPSTPRQQGEGPASPMCPFGRGRGDECAQPRKRGHSTFLFPVGLGRGGGESGRGQRERRWAGGAIT